MSKPVEEQTILGWREWVALPELGIEKIKAKIDTGARTSALHAHFLEPYDKNGEPWIRFMVHPFQRNLEVDCECHAKVVDYRKVTDSGGHTEHRYVIHSTITLGETSFMTEFTLTNRETMQFRMLLGRNTLAEHYVVDSGKSFLLKRKIKKIKQLSEKVL
jgi:hypothetical protein